MKKVQKSVDLNAHICQLDYKVFTKDGNAFLKLSFFNLGFGNITAIKFVAQGYNSFGDSVMVNDRA